jgi:hypothetical protein
MPPSGSYEKPRWGLLVPRRKGRGIRDIFRTLLPPLARTPLPTWRCGATGAQISRDTESHPILPENRKFSWTSRRMRELPWLLGEMEQGVE